MEIRQLHYFVHATKTLSFTEAARLSHVAQSTLSQQVKQLEEELGVPLFHRLGKRIALTAEGKLFLHDATRLLDDERQALQRLADLSRLEESVLMPTYILTLTSSYQRKAVTEFLRMLSESSRLMLQTGNDDCEVCGETFLV